LILPLFNSIPNLRPYNSFKEKVMNSYDNLVLGGAQDSFTEIRGKLNLIL